MELPDRSKLEIKLVKNLGGLAPELQLQRDGLPLPGSPSDPAERVKQAS